MKIPKSESISISKMYLLRTTEDKHQEKWPLPEPGNFSKMDSTQKFEPADMSTSPSAPYFTTGIKDWNKRKVSEVPILNIFINYMNSKKYPDVVE